MAAPSELVLLCKSDPCRLGTSEWRSFALQRYFLNASGLDSSHTMLSMKPRVYVETSVISYLTARSSSNILLLARQQFTRELWDLQPSYFEAWLSPLVLDEASRGDSAAAANRLQVCHGLPELEITGSAKTFAQQLVDVGAVPPTEPEDALHIALATMHTMDYIASWNFAHLVGPVARFKLLNTISALGHKPPIIATPEEIFEELTL